jgi:hypothetical protein
MGEAVVGVGVFIMEIVDVGRFPGVEVDKTGSKVGNDRGFSIL